MLLDTEAVQSLMDPRHAKHRRAVSILAALVGNPSPTRRARERAVPLVPTAVRVEAGWDRRAPEAAAINAFSIVDVALDSRAADRAAGVAVRLGVSVADAHIAAAALTTGGPCVVITSDPSDMRRIADHLDIDLRPVRL